MSLRGFAQGLLRLVESSRWLLLLTEKNLDAMKFAVNLSHATQRTDPLCLVSDTEGVVLESWQTRASPQSF